MQKLNPMCQVATIDDDVSFFVFGNEVTKQIYPKWMYFDFLFGTIKNHPTLHGHTLQLIASTTSLIEAGHTSTKFGKKCEHHIRITKET